MLEGLEKDGTKNLSFIFFKLFKYEFDQKYQDFAIFSSSKGEHKGKVEGVRPGFECLLVFIGQFTFGNLLNFLSFRFLKLE